MSRSDPADGAAYPPALPPRVRPPEAGDVRGRAGADVSGFTLLEMMIVSVILGTLAALALPRLSDAVLRAQVARATTEIKMLEVEIYDHWNDKGALPATLAAIGRGGLLDPWGNPYSYLPIATAGGGGRGRGRGGGGGVGQYRKDRFLVPLNSDFDLYSMGADGRSQAPLSAAASQDDVVRANDGGFVGLGRDY